MGETTSERGTVADDVRTHAAVKSLRGTHALCGAGTIMSLAAGRFDTDDPEACADCVSRLRPS
jgi:hypothetical protein